MERIINKMIPEIFQELKYVSFQIEKAQGVSGSVKNDPQQSTLLLNFRTPRIKKGSLEENMREGKSKQQKKSYPNNKAS